eukprot:TRINITY_DN67807_c3_g9_i1.p1 TRINITY_DN67807_c3_g9~~TRINITY_DN67807_c3_g9_i1.p1  ORF type:complete len:211 (-),score=96.91 TRINITY_DN67807_c3_g9_i1:38-670(-)
MSEENAAAEKLVKAQLLRKVLARRRRKKQQQQQQHQASSLRSPFVPTSHEAVAAFLKIAKVTKDDVVVDLGCGDGRVVIAAAQQSGARECYGVELNGELVERARKAASGDERSRESVTIMHCSVDAEEVVPVLRKATVVFVFMLPDVTKVLRGVLLKHLPDGAHIVTYTFRLVPAEDERWKPSASVAVKSKHTQLFCCRLTPSVRAQFQS